MSIHFSVFCSVKGVHLFVLYLTGMFENGLETDSEEMVCEKKEILKDEDRSVEDDPLYFSDPENVISKDGDHLKNGELISITKITRGTFIAKSLLFIDQKAFKIKYKYTLACLCFLVIGSMQGCTIYWFSIDITMCASAIITLQHLKCQVGIAVDTGSVWTIHHGSNACDSQINSKI